MKIIQTADLTPESTAALGDMYREWVYNGLDCCVTLEVLHAIKPQLDNNSTIAYSLSRELQAPVLEMNCRGVRIDPTRRMLAIKAYETDLKKVEENFNYLVRECFGIAINWRSNADLMNIFYTLMKIPPVKKRNTKSQYVPTVDRDALEKLQVYQFARPFINHVLVLKDLGKKISTLKSSIDPDGRARTSYNIAGTTTFRFSSSMSEFGTGGNLQNIENRLRASFVSDPGMKFGYVDLEQAESRAVGALCWNLFRDGKYLDACESGDLHTSVCRMAWTHLPWTGDLKKDRVIAEQPFYRQHSYRHMAKVLGHGSNYRGKPYTMALHTKLDQRMIAEFQERYFAAFPAIRLWHQWTEDEIRRSGVLVTPWGHRRYFFGRRTEDSTIREAIAFVPQSTIGVMLNKGMLNVWRAGICQLLLQIHDAIVVQFPEADEDKVVPQLIELIRQPLPLEGGRTLVVPSEAKTGWNWADVVYGPDGRPIDNLDGLAKYKGKDTRRRLTLTETLKLDI